MVLTRSNGGRFLRRSLPFAFRQLDRRICDIIMRSGPDCGVDKSTVMPAPNCLDIRLQAMSLFCGSRSKVDLIAERRSFIEVQS